MTSHRSGETENSYIAEVFHVVESVLPSTISFLELRLSWMDGTLHDDCEVSLFFHDRYRCEI